MLKRLLGLMIFGGLIFMSSANLMAQEEKTDAPLQTEDLRQLREAAKAINQILGGESLPEEESTTVSKSQQVKKPVKTSAEVADKALNILSGYVGSAAKAMEKVAPEVWRVMIRQQYAKAISAPFFDFAVLFFVGLYVVIIKRWWQLSAEEKKTIEDGGNWSDNAGWHFVMTNCFPFILFMIFGLLAAYNLKSSVQMLVNPEYYAFSDLLQLLLNKGMVK